MPGVASLIDRLPSLYRPEPGDGTLLTALLTALAHRLDDVRHDAAGVLQAHWAEHADRAELDPWFTLRRSRAGLPPLAPTDVLDLADARPLVRALRDRASPLATYLAGHLREPTATALGGPGDDERLPPHRLRLLLDDLNRVARGPLAWDPDRFQGFAIDPGTIARAEADPPGAERVAVNVRLLVEAFPTALAPAVLDLDHVRDLGRIGALVPLPPWREPPSLQETAEAYRLRLARMMALYRNGMGTVGAVRRMVEATLPVDIRAPAEGRDLPFTVEELPVLALEGRAAATTGPPEGVLGPLMRWSVSNPGVGPGETMLLLQGVAPEAGRIDATVDPMVELFTGEGVVRPVAVGMRGGLDPGDAVALRPAWNVWLAGDDGLRRSEHEPGDSGIADPSGPGVPADPGDLDARIVALHFVHDGTLRAATAEVDGPGAILRYDGQAWTEVTPAPAAVRWLGQQGEHLLLGTAAGLFRLPLHPAPGESPAPDPVQGFEDVAVRAVLHDPATGQWWVGADDGLLRWNGEAPPGRVPVGGEADLDTPVHALHIDGGGVLHLGTDLGAFQWQRRRDAWYWYEGREHSDQVPEWTAVDVAPPGSTDAFLPVVRWVHRGPDGALWFGTDAGVARYHALSHGGHSFQTVLEAFPDLGTGPVSAVREDGRGGLWFATDRGVLRFDGRDWWQRRGDAWAHLGRADVLPGPLPRPRGAWRFDRATGRWQRFDPRGAGWITVDLDLRTSAEPAVHALLFTPSVAAVRGTMEDGEFVPADPVDPADLFVRVKPEPDRIEDGGLPFIPPLPPGLSTWRYLRREPDDLEEPGRRPSWSVEGRLFPPPPDLDAPFAGRFDRPQPVPASASAEMVADLARPEGHFDQAVFHFPPAARVAFGWAVRRPATLLVRLIRRPADPPFDPLVLDRVWDGIGRVRPAGVLAVLAVDETYVRGVD
jgi:hypothetical protein